jgi:hypothetical protein
MGSRGRGALKRTFLGSVSDYCVHHCDCPVVIVRGTESTSEFEQKRTHEEKEPLLPEGHHEIEVNPQKPSM